MEKLEFFPGLHSFPNAYFRFKAGGFSGLRVPQETVILPHSEAQTTLARLSDSIKAVKGDSGAIGSTDPIFVASGDVVPPFASKVLKAVLKQLSGEDKEAFKSLKECKSFGLLVPSKTDEFPEWEGIEQVFSVGKLKRDAAQFQLKEPFPELGEGLIKAELLARQRLGRTLTLQMGCETSQMFSPGFGLAGMLSKLACGVFGEALETWIKAKRACRQSVLSWALNTREPKTLIESSPFCASLFPDDKVKEVLDLAGKEGKTLFQRWNIPSPSGSGSSKSSFSVKKGAKKAKVESGRKQKVDVSSYAHSTKTILQREDSQPSYKGKGGGRGGKGKGGRGKGGKGVSSRGASNH